MSIFESVEAYDDVFSLENAGYAAARSATFQRITSAYKKCAGKIVMVNNKFLKDKKIKLTKFKIDFHNPIWKDGDTFEVGKVEDGRVITGEISIEPSAIWLNCYCDVKLTSKLSKKEKVVRKQIFDYGQLEENNFCKVVG